VPLVRDANSVESRQDHTRFVHHPRTRSRRNLDTPRPTRNYGCRVIDPSRLTRFDVLASLDDEQRAAIAAVAEKRSAPAGDDLTRSGEFGYHLYFIEEGEVEVLRAGEVIATLGPGDHFGEVALMVTGQRTADVRARTPVELIVIFDRDVRELDRTIPGFGRSLRVASGPRMPGAS
jgi:CRP/FNR family transcriptional regulator, cyclic AMP receptor protein